MNRSEAFVLLTLIGLLALVLALAFCVPSTGAQDGTPTPFCVQLNGDHTWLEIGCPTNEPTATPTHTPTPTSTPSVTPSPTATPTATRTPDVTAEPTPEQHWLTCKLRNDTQDVIRVRASPGTSDLDIILGATLPSETITAEGIYYGDDHVWYLVWWPTGRYGWTADFYTELTDCSGLIERQHYELGLHLGPGFQCDLAYTNPEITAWKGVSSTEDCFHMLLEAFPDSQFVWRTLLLGDAPPGWGVEDPIAVANARYAAEKIMWKLYGFWDYMIDPGYDLYVEYVNEIPWPGDEWAVAFHLRMLELATADGICLSVFSEGYGNPTFEQWANYGPVFQYILDHPCKPNRLHSVALHEYSTAVDSDFNPVYDRWLFNRWEEFWAMMADQIGHEAYLVPLLVTELGVINVDGEYTGYKASDCERAWRELEVIDRQIFSRRPEVYAAYVWVGSTIPTWTNFNRCFQ